MTGPSSPPDLRYHAYRKDLADVALAGRVLASHYAEPVERSVAKDGSLRAAPSDMAEEIGRVEAGDPFLVVEDSVGWAWGYAGADRRVGYFPSKLLS